MKECILKNNLKLIYKKNNSELTSICISVDAGAAKEKSLLGLAHATEHMVYKGTTKRNESDINKELSEIFGFQNAMTNFPYVIYYGTMLNEDIEKAVELFSDIIIEPAFQNCGFKEEMDVIKQELREWDEETEQYCEDKIFYNCFSKRRIKYPIIGTIEDLDKITLADIKDFYLQNYFPENTTITIISNREYEDIKKIVENYFGKWKQRYKNRNDADRNIDYESPCCGIFENEKSGLKTCRAEIISPINRLNKQEVFMLKIFNEYFCQGENSILYEKLRTEYGIVYNILSNISDETYINLYKITFASSKEDIYKAVELIKECIKKLEDEKPDNINVNKIFKRLKMKKLFREEKSIILAKEISTYDIMYGDYKRYTDDFATEINITAEDVLNVGKLVLKNISIQIIC